LKGEILLLITTVIGGTAYVVSKSLLLEISPENLIFYRFLFGIIFLVILRPKSVLTLDRQTLGLGAGVGAVMALSMFALFYGLRTTGSGIAAFLANSEFLFIPFIELLLFKKRISRLIWLSLSLGVIGIILISLGKDLRISLGELFLCASSIGFAFTAILSVRATRLVPTYKLTISMMLFAGLLAGIVSATQGSLALPPIAVLPHLLYIGIVVTGLRFLLVLIAQRSVSASHSGIIYLAEPVVAAIFGVVLLKEQLTMNQILGMVSMLLAALLIVTAPLWSTNQER